MLFAYIDESGDTGEVARGGSRTYALGCILVESARWVQTFDDILDFRRQLKTNYAIPIRAELKANYLLRNSGAIRNLNLAPGQRHAVWRGHLRFLQRADARAFAVVIDKQGKTNDIFAMAWETMLQRLERTSNHDNTPIMIIHDQGEDDRIRKVVRKSRRHLTAGSQFNGAGLRIPFRLLTEDPVSRNSAQSFFIQIADLVAYTGFRTFVPPPPNINTICPPTLWNELGTATHTAVNSYSGGTPGVVVR